MLTKQSYAPEQDYRLLESQEGYVLVAPYLYGS
jgi:hypothetical protein